MFRKFMMMLVDVLIKKDDYKRTAIIVVGIVAAVAGNMVEPFFIEVCK